MNTDKHRYENQFQISNFKFQIIEKSVFICVHLWLISLCFFASPTENRAQVRPVYDYGAIGLGQLLKRLNNTKSVMHIGAHPDDEDSGLLAFLARGENARTAYLSLTRGDGGQNIIGPELFESLGIIRTEELLQARRLDGAEQYFTRAFDYGFSKTLDEAKQKWDEKIILCDAVKAIRTFRPLVVISRFSGTPADGHGQHQYAGYIAPLAVKAAADANQCKDSGAAWQVLKFYVGQGFRSTEKPTLSVNTGEYDFLLGRSYFEIAMEGRSQHKTQEQGVLELRGERFSGLNLVESKVAKAEKETSIFDGIDTSLANMLQNHLKDEKNADEFTKTRLAIVQQSAERALREYEPSNPRKIVSVLAEGAEASAQLNNSYAIFHGNDEKRKKEYFERFRRDYKIYRANSKTASEFRDAAKLAAGIQIDALADKETVAPGENFQAGVKVFFPNAENIKVKEISLHTPQNWKITKAEETQDANQNPFRREVANDSALFNVKVAPDAPPTEPYFLKNERNNYLYDLDYLNLVEKYNFRNLPFQPPTIFAWVTIEIDGKELIFTQPVEYRYADDVRGEVRRALDVVPKISLSFDQELLIAPITGKAQTRKITLNVANNSSAETNGEVRLNLPKELKFSPAAANFNLKKKGEKASVAFDITIPANIEISDFDISAQAAANGETFDQTMHTLAYPHISTHRFYTAAKTKIKLFDLKIAPARIGYIMGSGDAVPEAIRQMNLTVEMLSENDLTSGDLSKYDAIVVGIRAFQVRADLISNNQKVLDYVKNGGHLIVQYQRPEYESLLPFPAKLGARVADENATVTILDQTNPIFNFPNKITAQDFDGWVQERNLYAFSTFDANYKPLLEAHDNGEAENKGGLVVAEIGKGKYTYCSYAFFRQLPAGVPGAYRLFANLLSAKER